MRTETVDVLGEKQAIGQGIEHAMLITEFTQATMKRRRCP